MRFRVYFGLGVLTAAVAAFGIAPANAQVQVNAKAMELTVTGRVHTQFNTTSDDSSLGSEFQIRRARLTAELKINDKVSGKIQPDYGRGRISLKDAYMKFMLAPSISLVAGQFKRPFDMFELTSSTEILVIERTGFIRGADGFVSYSAISALLGLSDRDVGVGLEMKSASKQFGLDIAITNGTGANRVPSRLEALDLARIGEKQYLGRIAVRPLEERDFSLHLAATMRPVVQPAADSTVALVDRDVEYSNAFEVSGEWGNFKEGLHLRAGALFGENWIADRAKRPSFVTVQGIASIKLPLSSDSFEAWEPLLRVSWADPNKDTSDDGGLLFTPGLQLFLEGRNKIALNVDVFVPDSSDLDTEYSIKAQTNLHF